MIDYNKINVKLSNLQLSKLKNAVKNNAGTTLRISAKMFNSNNLTYELFLTQRQTTKLRNATENNMSSDMKLSKAQIKKIIMLGEKLGALLSKFARPSMKVAKKSISTISNNSCYVCNRCRNSKKIHGSRTTTLIFSNEEMKDVMKIVQALEDQNILLKGISEIVKNETQISTWWCTWNDFRYISWIIIRTFINRKRSIQNWLWK